MAGADRRPGSEGPSTGFPEVEGGSEASQEPPETTGSDGSSLGGGASGTSGLGVGGWGGRSPGGGRGRDAGGKGAGAGGGVGAPEGGGGRRAERPPVPHRGPAPRRLVRRGSARSARRARRTPSATGASASAA